MENEGSHSESLDHLGATGEELGLRCHLAVNHTTGERLHVLGVASRRYARFQPETASYPQLSMITYVGLEVESLEGVMKHLLT